jgi:hypothetical protein
MLLIFSCSKNSGTAGDDDNHVPVDVNDTSLPVIVIDKPVMNQAFTTGDTIKIQGTVTDNGLYRGKIKIVNDSNGLSLLDQPYEIHSLQLYNFSLAYKTSVSSVSNYTVIVEFEDHGLNVTTQSVKVKVNP